MQRLGLLALGLDATGKEVLDALAAKSSASGAFLLCHHAAVDAEAGNLLWQERSPTSSWQEPVWREEVGSLGAGLWRAVEDALSLERFRGDGVGVDLLDVVLLAPQGSLVVDPDLVSTLLSIRPRYRKVGRVLLVVRAALETAGESGPPGLVRPLPYADGEDRDLFAAVLLLDSVTTAGDTITDPRLKIEHAAEVLHHLTLGELGPQLFKWMQDEHGRLGPAARYVALGCASWRLSGEGAVEATAAHLGQTMAQSLAASAAETRGAGEPGEDSWSKEVEEALAATSEGDAPALARGLEARGRETLHPLLRGSGWSLARLAGVLAARRDVLHKLEAETARELAEFMPEFSEWFVRSELGRLKPGPPEMGSLEAFDETKALIFAVVAFLGIGATAAAFYWLGVPFGVGVGLAVGLALVILAIKGFKKTELREIAPGEPPLNLLPELYRRRRRRELVALLLEGNRKAIAKLKENIAALALETRARSGFGEFPFTCEVCASLLASRSLTVGEAVETLWSEEPGTLAAALGDGEESLLDQISAFARERCRRFADLEWGELFRALGGVGSLATPLWEKAMEQAQADALPWMPVWGQSTKTLLALPNSLPHELREVLETRFPAQKATVAIEGNAVVVVCVTQGYREG